MSCLVFSAAKSESASGTRRSNRLSKKDADPQTPQNILRRSLKHKLHEVRKTSRVNADDGQTCCDSLTFDQSTFFADYNQEISARYQKEDRLSGAQKDDHTSPNLTAA